MNASSIEKRIAAALTGSVTAAEVATLLQEAEAAVTAADSAAEVARTRAFDPTILDPAARSAQQDAEHISARLRAALPRLQGGLAPRRPSARTDDSIT
jgi:hypothetical protein